MKNDLIKVLNFKLKNIENNIDELKRLNNTINTETYNLEYIKKIIGDFSSADGGFDIYKFSNLSRDDFNKLLMELDNDVLTKFGTSSCNYEGLIYLINGINNGISLTLTKEQTDAINLLIDKLLKKEKEYDEIIAKLNEDKQKLEIRDLNTLTSLQNNYSIIVDKLEENRYISEIDLITEALDYNDLSKDKKYDILCYLLKYNVSVYEKDEPKEEIKDNKKEDGYIDLTVPFENKDSAPIEFSKNNKDEDVSLKEEVQEDENNETIEININDEETKEDFNDVEQPNLDFMKVDEEKEDIEQDFSDDNNYEVEQDEDFNDLTAEDYEDYNPLLPENESNYHDLALVNENEKNNEEAYDDKINSDESHEEADYKEFSNESETTDIPISFEENNLDDKKDISSNNEKLNINDVTSLLNEYQIKYDNLDDVVKAQLLKGDLDNYRKVLAKLKELKVLENLNKNNIVDQYILYSNVSIIDEIIAIIGNDLSVDEDDKRITTLIVFETMPSIFMNGEHGNYNNFVENIKSFREYGIDLINLFDFSKEIFVASHSRIVDNYNIIRNYDLTVNARNAKYLLLLPNIATKIDYYIEASYKDNMKGSNGEIFDGIDFIRLYPSKLNMVTDETIKRLRYSSENGKKIFGSKEKSLAGEITNLKVDILNLSDDYRRNFFNNEFDIISRDDALKYEKLILVSRNVELKVDDYVSKLENKRNGLRYIIEGIYVSRNKVLRNYNILINNGVSKDKALLFAVCHNLVVTKEEYNKIKEYLVNSLGGN